MMNLDTLRAKVLSSRLLTEQERRYWLDSLPHMNPEQLMKLDRILSEAAGIPWDEHMQQYLDMIQRGTKAMQTIAAA